MPRYSNEILTVFELLRSRDLWLSEKMTVLSRNADLWKILYYPTITDFYRPMTPLLKQLSWGVEILPFFSVANEIYNPAYKNVSE